MRDKVKKERAPSAHSSGSNLNDAAKKAKKKPKGKADQIKLSINKYGTTRYDTITAKSGHQVISALQQYLMVGAAHCCNA